jgi:hypothetical protein
MNAINGYIRTEALMLNSRVNERKRSKKTTTTIIRKKKREKNAKER